MEHSICVPCQSAAAHAPTTYPPRATPVSPSVDPHGAPAATYPSPRHDTPPPCPSYPSIAPRPPHRSARRRGLPLRRRRRLRHPHMADDAVAGAAGHCARPAPPPPSSRRQQHLDDGDDDAGRGGSDVGHRQHDVIMLRRTRSGRAFPPPISVIGKGGRPWLSLRAHREGGRLVLREMRLPSQELLQPCKEDGRFKLLIHPEAGGRAAAAAPQERHGKEKSALDQLTR
ncbi:hypothetical protein SETIT_7G091300v2 [Setaria italica]|uniref:FAF domain-containing protein n=1 Tax=Setaria italica TaxID=4555 RepID=A0A368RTQ9_SETIT|nr:hypothetical protein SETIT_7G091300v2 [Setaria italica]